MVVIKNSKIPFKNLILKIQKICVKIYRPLGLGAPNYLLNKRPFV